MGAALASAAIRIRRLALQDYLPTLEGMRAFTAGRDAQTPDELWVLEHPPVYTLGLAADRVHAPGADCGIPVIAVERGGEITYHGPGQAVLYTLVDLARRGLKVREFVSLLEASALELLAAHGVPGEVRRGAPGVYVGGAKIAALGLRVSHGRAYHGLAMNVDMDLAPFAAIAPCGFPGLAVTQARDLGIPGSAADIGARLAANLAGKLEDA